MLLFVVKAQSRDTSLLFTCSYSQLQHSHVTHLCCLHALIHSYSTVTWHILLFTCSHLQFTVTWHIFVVYMLLFAVTAQSRTHLCCLHALIRSYNKVMWHIFVVYMLLFVVTAQSRDTSLLFTCSYSQLQHSHVTHLCCLHALIRSYSTVTWHIFVVYRLFCFSKDERIVSAMLVNYKTISPALCISLSAFKYLSV